jgi:hypothetical protein
MARKIPEYVQIETGEICKVLRRSYTDFPIRIGDDVIVEWNETTALCRKVKRLATEQEYLTTAST